MIPTHPFVAAIVATALVAMGLSVTVVSTLQAMPPVRRAAVIGSLRLDRILPHMVVALAESNTAPPSPFASLVAPTPDLIALCTFICTVVMASVSYVLYVTRRRQKLAKP